MNNGDKTMNILEMIKNEKVEWKKLGEIARCFAGGTPKTSKREYYGGNIPWIRSGEINFNIIKSSEIKITEEGLKHSSAKMIRPNSVVVAMTGATVGRSGVVEFETACNQSIAAIENDENLLNYKYLYYYISNKYEYIKNLGQGALTSLNLSMIKNFEIPIPSLEVQEKIVETLDTMVQHFTQLQAELQAREKQYNYYRDMLLSEDHLNNLSKRIDKLKNKEYSLKETTLGEIGKISMCKRIMKNETNSTGDVPFYKIGTFGDKADAFISKDLFLEYKEKYSYPKKGNVLFSASGTIGRTVIFDGSDSYYQDSNIVWIDNDETKVLDKYLYYFYQIVNWPVSKGGTISRIYNRDINNIKIKLPPLEIQNKVVEVLDKFQELISNAQGLLPDEISQRQKQYEYYREKLLTFNEECAKVGRSVGRSVVAKGFFEILNEAVQIAGVKLCSIEKKKLGELLDYVQPTKYIVKTTDYNDNYSIPVLTAGKTFILGYTDEKYGIYNASIYNPVIIFDDFTSGNHWVDFDFKVKSSAMKFLKPKPGVNLRYCYHYMQTIRTNIADHKRLWISKYSKNKILIPPREVQDYVVDILDKFDTIVNDIREGLPREIELRQKQYEYYREKLLDFKR